MSERGAEAGEAEESLMGGSAGTRPLWLYASDAHVWHKVAGISGAAALACGTYGAHVFKPENLAYKEVWQTANLYHLVHTAALLAAPLTKRPTVYGSLLTFGIVAFSGSPGPGDLSLKTDVAADATRQLYWKTGAGSMVAWPSDRLDLSVGGAFGVKAPHPTLSSIVLTCVDVGEYGLIGYGKHAE